VKNRLEKDDSLITKRLKISESRWIYEAYNGNEANLTSWEQYGQEAKGLVAIYKFYFQFINDSK
jgi:hypothetical protein